MDSKERTFSIQAVIKKFESDEGLYIFIMQVIANLYSLLVHIVSIVAFIIVGLDLFIWLNAIGIVIYAINFFLINKGLTRLASLFLVIEVASYSTAVSILFGGKGLFILYFFLISILQFNMPATNPKRRTLAGVILWIMFIVAFYFSTHTSPTYEIGSLEIFFEYFNVNVVFLGIIVKMLVGDLIKKYLENVNKKRMEELRIIAHTDQLTGLYNRHYAALIFDHMKSSPEPKRCFIAMLDIDDFKIINDTYGHAFGDRILMSLAKTLKDTLRRSDHIFRWGGEEFLIVLEGVDEERADMVLNGLKNRISDTGVEVSAGKMVNYTVTIGAAPFYLENIDDSISLSDKKLYKGKRKGKNVVII